MAAPEMSVREVLRVQSESAAEWATFDPTWYLAAYPSAQQLLDDADPRAVLQYYFDHGQNLGHSPNIYFDELWHRRRYPRVAKAITNGRVASAFDSYCRGGLYGRSPHWLFDELLYRSRYPDLTEHFLAENGLMNGYHHYLRHGDRSGRSGHLLFDPSSYAAELDPEERQQAGQRGWFAHFLASLPLAPPEPRTSVYFAPDWYRSELTRAGTCLAEAEWRCALHHYLCNDTPTQFDPVPEFSERYYLGRYGDVATSVRAGKYRNGYEHFLARGQEELRAPSRQIDLASYAATPEWNGVSDDSRPGGAQSRDAFGQYLAAGRMHRASTKNRANEALAQDLIQQKAASLLPLRGWRPLDFSCGTDPALSVIMVLNNRFAMTLLPRGSLRDNSAGSMELLLVDAGSADEARHIEKYVSGARFLRFDDNVGFVHACNAGLQISAGPFVLVIDSAVELACGAIASALQRLRSQARAGAVGGKIIRDHGLLQEAGCIIWRDATTSRYMENASPLVPEANFVREVDYCSSVFLMLRGDLLRALDGFDERFSPAGYEDADLCARIGEAGYDVIYDPAVIVFRHQSDDTDEAGVTGGRTSRNRRIFARKHAEYLRHRPIREEHCRLPCRFGQDDGRRVLLIEDMIPLRRLGSGFVRSNDLIQVMASIGYRVTVFPLKAGTFDIAHIYADMPETVEVMHDRGIEALEAFLHERKNYFDVVWVARTHNLHRIISFLRPMLAASAQPPDIVLDTEALEAVRNAVYQEIMASDSSSMDVAKSIALELEPAGICKSVIAVSRQEAATLHDLGWKNIAVIGHMRRVDPTPRDFAARTGLLFVGAIHQQESPNYDSLDWFVREVLPILEESLGWRTRLTIVGYTAPGVSLAHLANHPRITLRGMLVNTEQVYDQHRVFVAPTRYAAGLPYKVYEAASFGIPIVASDLLRRQMGWENGHDLLSADTGDPEEFARQIIAVYDDAALWRRLRTNALARLERENSPEHYADVVAGVLGQVRRSPATFSPK